MSKLSEALVPDTLLPAKKKRGRAAKERPVRKDALMKLELDLAKDPADQILPCTERQQADHLGWYVSEVRSVNQDLRLYEKLPMLCLAEGCVRADDCPTGPDFLFKGLRCPMEIQEVYRGFVRYIRELEVDPAKYADLKLIEDLVTIDLQISRIDHEVKHRGMLTLQTAGIAQKTAEPVKDLGLHPLLQFQNKLRENRLSIYKKLLADRDSKQKVEQQQKKREADALDLIARLKAAVSERLAVPGQIIDVTPVLSPVSLPDEPDLDPDDLDEPAREDADGEPEPF